MKIVYDRVRYGELGFTEAFDNMWAFTAQSFINSDSYQERSGGEMSWKPLPKHYRRFGPWWTCDLSKKEAFALIATQSKNLNRTDGVLYVQWQSFFQDYYNLALFFIPNDSYDQYFSNCPPPKDFPQNTEELSK